MPSSPGSKSTAGLSKGVNTEITFADHLRRIMDDIQQGAYYKDRNPNPYINAIDNLHDVCYIYILEDANFYEEISYYNKMLMEQYGNIRSKDDKEHYKQNVYPVKSASYLYKAILGALKRQHLLPRNKVVIYI